jgi:hypothetical protein
MTLLHETLDRFQQQLLRKQTTRLDLSLLTQARTAGFQPTGIGSHRLVVSLPDDLVAKLAVRDIGVRDNEVEWHVYHTLAEHERMWLCPPVTLTEGNVLVVRRCLPISPSHTEPVVRQAVEALARAGIGDVAVNLGVLDSTLVCYDYAQVSPGLLRRAARRADASW